jgi:hypothetical protein
MITSRRRFFAMGGASISAALTARLVADDLPIVADPRATDGDDRFEPNWEDRLTITVGRQKADLVGSDDKVLQAAVDYVAGKGGGTVKVLPGVFTLRAAVVLRSGVRLVGSGADSVITRVASERVALAADSDWYDQEVTLAKRGSFRVGDSVVFQAKDPSHDGDIVIKRTLIGRSGNRFKLDDGLRKNLWLSGNPTCASLFPLLTSERTADVTIENITLDGNRANTENFNGNYGGCVFLQDCNRYTLRKVEARNYNGDGISFQICHDVKVTDCHCHDNANLGVHPGSGSQRPLIRDCRLERNRLGLFWCWGVKYGLAEANRILDNHDYGISIGHNDTDNMMRNNEVIGSGKVGILFRDDARGADFWANRNVVENNRIEDSGGDDGIGIDIRGKTKDVRITKNTIRESRGPMQRIGIRISGDSREIKLHDNTVEGMKTAVLDARV